MSASKQFRARLTENEIAFILYLIEEEQETLELTKPKNFRPDDDKYKYVHKRMSIVLRFLHRKFSRLLNDGEHAKRPVVTQFCEAAISRDLQYVKELRNRD